MLSRKKKVCELVTHNSECCDSVTWVTKYWVPIIRASVCLGIRLIWAGNKLLSPFLNFLFSMISLPDMADRRSVIQTQKASGQLETLTELSTWQPWA